MTGQPEHPRNGDDTRGHRPDDQLGQEGAGLGMSDGGTTFEPEEAPEAVDGPGDGPAQGRDEPVAGGALDPRELVPDDDRVDELEAPREVLPDDERDVEDTVEQESERLLPDEERPVPGGPADDVL